MPRQCLMQAVKALILLDFLEINQKFTPLEDRIGIVRIGRREMNLTSFSWILCKHIIT